MDTNNSWQPLTTMDNNNNNNNVYQPIKTSLFYTIKLIYRLFFIILIKNFFKDLKDLKIYFKLKLINELKINVFLVQIKRT